MNCPTATEQNKTFAREKAFEDELDFIEDKVVNQKEILHFSTLCLLYTQELDRNGFLNPDYKSEKRNRLESHPIHEQIAHVYVKHCGSVFCGLIHSSEISVTMQWHMHRRTIMLGSKDRFREVALLLQWVFPI